MKFVPAPRLKYPFVIGGYLFEYKLLSSSTLCPEKRQSLTSTILKVEEMLKINLLA